MNIKIKTTSDNHGRIPDLKGKFNIWASTGDFFPDFFSSPREEWANLQAEWLKGAAAEIAPWLTKKKFVFCQGNHDFCPADRTEKILRDAGIDAYNAHDKLVTIDNIGFYGFPWVPPINGSFNYETGDTEMVDKIDKMVDVINNNIVDVVLMHAPPYDILDTYRSPYGITHGGNVHINNAIDYKIEKERMPTAFCFGHIHDSAAVKVHQGILMVNSALTSNIIEIY